MLGFLKKRSTDPRRELRRLVGDYELPGFRANMLAVLRLLRDEDAGIDRIARQIELDPGMHVRVLRTVNAAAFGLSTPVGSLPHAISLLGRSRIEPLVLTLAVQEALPRPDGPGFDLRRFWFHSAARAAAARRFARRLHPGTQHESFTAGLLLDLAVPVLMSVRGKDYAGIYRDWIGDRSVPLQERERKGLGYDHSEAGTLIAEAWDLPGNLRAAIATHHAPDETDPALHLAALIHDAHRPEETEPIVETARQRYALAPDTTLEVVEEAFREAGDFSALLA